jgi:5'-methylthioadenosine phosphorylase
VEQAGATVHMGGNFVTIEGPRFSTRVESLAFRQLGMDIIGMTTTPEAFLAREAEMSFACMAHVTDYDVWHETEEAVTVEAVVRTLMRNAEVAIEAVANAIELLAESGPSPYANALQGALMTDKAAIPPEVIDRLEPILGKYFDR